LLPNEADTYQDCSNRWNTCCNSNRGLILLVKATSDELDTVTDQNGKKITIRIAGDPMQHVQWVTSGWWDRGGDAVVSEALSRTITPAKPPCRLIRFQTDEPCRLLNYGHRYLHKSGEL